MPFWNGLRATVARLHTEASAQSPAIEAFKKSARSARI
jgi:hypothetical protein